MLPPGSRVELAENADMVRLLALVSASPMVNGIGPAASFISVFVRGMVEMTGDVLAGSTVRLKEALLDLPPESATQTVIEAEPACPAAVTATVLAELLPPKRIFVAGTMVGSEEKP